MCYQCDEYEEVIDKVADLFETRLRAGDTPEALPVLKEVREFLSDKRDSNCHWNEETE